MASPSIKLNNGYSMPQVGFGLWKVDNATCADTVYNAIKTGYRLFDGACGRFALFPNMQHELIALVRRLRQREGSRGGCRPSNQGRTSQARGPILG